jgi:hypothetical protein
MVLTRSIGVSFSFAAVAPARPVLRDDATEPYAIATGCRAAEIAER